MRQALGTTLCIAMFATQSALASVLSVGPNVNITKATGNQAESTISVNPTNPLQLFATDTISNVGRFSADGGLTWSLSSGIPASLGDVQTAWDSFGNLFLTEFGPSLSVVVTRSIDGGATFGDVRTLSAGGNDQPSIAVGAGSVWATFLDPSVGIVAAGAPVTGLDAVGAFSVPQVAPGSLATFGNFGDIAVGPSGQVAVVYQNSASGNGPDSIRFNLDPDGLAGVGFGAQSIVTSTNIGGFDYITPQPTRSVDAEANLAWDRSGGAHDGRLYMVYTDENPNESNDTDIFLRYSDDNGVSWSAPVRVNDDATTRSQFLPAIAVDQTTGNVAITWYDARNSAFNDTTQIFGTISEDGGLSFLPNVQISTGTSSSAVDPGFDFGDYDKMDFNDNMFWRTWADSSNSTGDNPDGTTRLDIYTAKVTLFTDATAPEPATWLLLAIGGALLLANGQRRRAGRWQIGKGRVIP